MELLNSTQNTTEAASRPPIVEYFGMDGLFGYRSVSLSSNFAATILIARNGSGKTTLIAALDAFLRGQFTRFAGLPFDTVVCKLRGHSEPLTLSREDVDQLIGLTSDSEILGRAKAWEVEPLALLELLESGIDGKNYPDLMDNPTFHLIYTKNGYDFQVAFSQCRRLELTLRGKNPNIDSLRGTLKAILGDTEIVYLPTYRRIELSLPEVDSRRNDRRKSILARLGVARIGLYTADIQFGLGDISARLRAIYSEMLYRSNQGYGKISANVINDLISGNYKNDSVSRRDPPSKESLEIFFSRIKDAEREYRRNSYSNFFTAPNLDRVYSGDVPTDAQPFLSYFLEQLNSVMQETRETEELVEAFINNCNRYLSGDDFSTDQYSTGIDDAFDKKKLTFNRRSFEVKVTSSATGDEVSLEALSSGEKQMISLFARLYLYPGPKMVLIDEPELSLSLDWQRQILPDVLKAPTCQQVIAITHSPFIFDNELEPFAGSLRFKASPNRTPPLFPTTPFEGEGGERDL